MARTELRHLGICPVCGRQWKVQRQKLVIHGYKRPGWGSIDTECFGSGKAPWELSPDTAIAYLRLVEGTLRQLEKALADLPSATVLYSQDSWGKVTTYPLGDPHFPRVLEGKKIRMQSQIHGSKMEIQRLEALIPTWRPERLREVVEEKQAKAKAQEERKARAVESRRDKLQKMVAGYQARIDAAVRNKSTSALWSIYEQAPYKISSIAVAPTTKAQALDLLDRNEVWRMFGLYPYINKRWDDYTSEDALRLKAIERAMTRGYQLKASEKRARWEAALVKR